MGMHSSFALAWLHRVFAAPGALTHAAETMDLVHARMALPGGGFHGAADRDWVPISGVIRQNPHMHLLEAILALYEASGDKRWLSEADALVQLFRERMYHRGTTTLREFFTGDWEPHPQHVEIIEPGHQFEWVWLLHQYRRRGGTLDVATEVDAPFRFALNHGIDPVHGGIHDRGAPNGTPVLRTHRVWPVAEAIKAFVVMTEAGEDHRADVRRFASQLLHDFVPTNRLGWYETLTREGAPSMTELPGSTPYHLFLAAAETKRLNPI
jgi:mannose/cellobiose epimerase-like protein (N-acyl-D-glucosamine 2-epimerase family)